MSRGLGWLESLTLDYLRKRRGFVSFDALLSHCLMYGDYQSYRGRSASLKRTMNSLIRKGLAQEEKFQGVIVYRYAQTKHK